MTPGGGAKSHGLRSGQRVCASYVEYLRYGLNDLAQLSEHNVIGHAGP
jgi:hypothetical protein